MNKPDRPRHATHARNQRIGIFCDSGGPQQPRQRSFSFCFCKPLCVGTPLGARTRASSVGYLSPGLSTPFRSASQSTTSSCARLGWLARCARPCGWVQQWRRAA